MTTCARSVVQCYPIGEVRCGIVVSVVISICVIELSVLILLVVILYEKALDCSSSLKFKGSRWSTLVEHGSLRCVKVR